LTSNTPLTDIELLKRVSNSDSKALEILYNRYSPLLYTIIKKIVTDEETAQQALAEVFVIVWRKIDRFDCNTGNPYTWLVTLTRNKAVDIIRRRRSDSDFREYDDKYENDFIIPSISNNAEALDLKEALNKRINFEEALNKLTDAQQYVIYLAYYQGFTEKEIAAKLNIPEQTVKSKIKFALINLRDNLAMEEM
jgi:RNA polymerase sigma-70 factor (ECF subfamily)